MAEVTLTPLPATPVWFRFVLRIGGLSGALFAMFIAARERCPAEAQAAHRNL
jgi:hypothetical protein